MPGVDSPGCDGLLAAVSGRSRRRPWPASGMRECAARSTPHPPPRGPIPATLIVSPRAQRGRDRPSGPISVALFPRVEPLDGIDRPYSHRGPKCRRRYGAIGESSRSQQGRVAGRGRRARSAGATVRRNPKDCLRGLRDLCALCRRLAVYEVAFRPPSADGRVPPDRLLGGLGKHCNRQRADRGEGDEHEKS